MKLLELTFLYFLVGTSCAVALYRRAPDPGRANLAAALIAVPLWPLWVPIAWTARRELPPLDFMASDVVHAIRSALDEGVTAAAGTPLERLLNREAAVSIVAEVTRLATRRHEILTLLAREEFDVERAQRRIEDLQRGGATSRTGASARLHLDNVRRLRQLAERDSRTLEELAGLVQALRTQLVFVKLSGSSAEGVGDIVSELWSRIEGLSEASDEALRLGPAESPT
jgi:hypothetical protein